METFEKNILPLCFFEKRKNRGIIFFITLVSSISKQKNKMKADRYDLGVILNALDRKRKNELAKGNDTKQVDNLILKLLKIYETLKNSN